MMLITRRVNWRVGISRLYAVLAGMWLIGWIVALIFMIATDQLGKATELWLVLGATFIPPAIGYALLQAMLWAASGFSSEAPPP